MQKICEAESHKESEDLTPYLMTDIRAWYPIAKECKVPIIKTIFIKLLSKENKKSNEKDNDNAIISAETSSSAGNVAGDDQILNYLAGRQAFGDKNNLNHNGNVILPDPIPSVPLLPFDPRADMLEDDGNDDGGKEDDDESWDDDDEQIKRFRRKFEEMEMNNNKNNVGDNHGVAAKEEEEEEEEDSSNVNRVKYQFPLIEKQIYDAIVALGGYAFPKLNWTAPIDASWVSGSLKCQSVGDVYMILKSSDFIHHDIELWEKLINKTDIEPTLALRSWCNFNPAMEFRCFVYQRSLTLIVQRNAGQYYPFLDQMKGSILDNVCNFYEATSKKFDKNGKCCFLLDTFEFDIYIDTKMKVWLVDINRLMIPSDKNEEEAYLHPLATWDEVKRSSSILSQSSSSASKTIIKVIQSEKDKKRDQDMTLSMHKVPYDMVVKNLNIL